MLRPRYFFALFATDEGVVRQEDNREYTPLVKGELLTREMTKKEIKMGRFEKTNRPRIAL